MLGVRTGHTRPAGWVNLVNFVNIEKPTRESGHVAVVRELLIDCSVTKPVSSGPSTARSRNSSACSSPLGAAGATGTQGGCISLASIAAKGPTTMFCMSSSGRLSGLCEHCSVGRTQHSV